MSIKSTYLLGSPDLDIDLKSYGQIDTKSLIMKINIILINNKHKTVHRCIISTQVNKGKHRLTKLRCVGKYEKHENI